MKSCHWNCCLRKHAQHTIIHNELYYCQHWNSKPLSILLSKQCWRNSISQALEKSQERWYTENWLCTFDKNWWNNNREYLYGCKINFKDAINICKISDAFTTQCPYFQFGSGIQGTQNMEQASPYLRSNASKAGFMQHTIDVFVHCTRTGWAGLLCLFHPIITCSCNFPLTKMEFINKIILSTITPWSWFWNE